MNVANCSRCHALEPQYLLQEINPVIVMPTISELQPDLYDLEPIVAFFIINFYL